MQYYIKQLASKRFEVWDLYANKKLEGTDAFPLAAFNKAMFHAYMTYGKIEPGCDPIPPKQVVKVSYKASYIDIKKAYTFGCRFHIKKLTVQEKEPQLQPTQLCLFDV